jgi:prepilin-type processing-associated H-X9-DG protein
VSLANPRNFSLNAFVGWVGAPVNGQGDDSKFEIFEAASDVPQPDAIFSFAEVNPMSICQPFFGVQMHAAEGVYHVPGNYHGRFSNFAFLDGHIERHRWVNPHFNSPDFSGDYHKAHTAGVPGTASKPDMVWLSQHASVRK